MFKETNKQNLCDYDSFQNIPPHVLGVAPKMETYTFLYIAIHHISSGITK